MITQLLSFGLALITVFIGYWIFTPIIQGRPRRFSNSILYKAFLCGIGAGLLVLSFKSLFFPELLRESFGKEILSMTIFISFIEAGILEECAKAIMFFVAVKLTHPDASHHPSLNKEGNPNFLSLLRERWLRPTGADGKGFICESSGLLTFLIGCLIGIGFGIMENTFYAVNYIFLEKSFHTGQLWEILQILFSRNFTSLVAHTIMAGSFAYLVTRGVHWFWAFIFVVFIHGVYDFFALPTTLLGNILVHIWLMAGVGALVYMGQSLNSDTIKPNSKNL